MNKTIILFSLLSFFLLNNALAEQTKSSNTFYTAFQKGRLFFDNKQYNKAVDEFEKLISDKPDYSPPYLYIAMINELNTNYNKAIEYYIKYLEAGGEKTGKVKESIQNIANLKYLTTDKEFEVLKKGDQYYLEGLQSAKEKKYSDAVKKFEKSLEIVPYYVKAHYALALALNSMKKYNEAYEHFMKVLKYDPDSRDYIETYYYLGLYYVDLLINDYDLALQFYKIYKEKNGSKNADKLIQAIEQVNVLLADSMKLYGENKKDEALKTLLSAKKIKPVDIRVLNNTGALYIEQNKYKEAEENLKIALEIKKDNEDTYYNLCCLYSKQGDTGKAIKYFREGIKIFSKDTIRKFLIDPDLANLRKSDDFPKIIQTKNFNK